MTKLQHTLFVSTLLFVGAGCVGIPEEPSLPPAECPDVCATICAGQPEPDLPPNCPIPGCACDSEPSALEPTDAERACERDEDCVYADNSVCPFTSLENIVAVNKTQADAFRARRPEPPKDTLCIELYAVPDEDPKCVSRLCTVPGSTIE